jgi:hypothetical protein
VTEETVRTTAVADEETMDESHGQPVLAVVEPEPEPEAEPERRGRTLPILGGFAALLIIAAAILWLLGQS